MLSFALVCLVLALTITVLSAPRAPFVVLWLVSESFSSSTSLLLLYVLFPIALL